LHYALIILLIVASNNQLVSLFQRAVFLAIVCSETVITSHVRNYNGPTRDSLFLLLQSTTYT